MAQLPGIVVTAFDGKEGPAIFATVDILRQAEANL